MSEVSEGKTMTKKVFIMAIAVAILIATGLVVRRAAVARELPAWRMAEVTRGDVEQTISATGSLSAVTTVSVGTQVSGQVAEIFVDFNDLVKKGQLLARIDPTLANQAVIDAQASLERTRAELTQASSELERNRSLRDSGLVAASAFESVEARFAVTRANVKSAQVSLERARQNLGFTEIHAPIDGVVVERNVDVGQTVAASLSAPQLFLIANDLSRMQILAQVDESDISRIREGQRVQFTVQALSGERFEGSVRQVRLQSLTQENVVTYPVVVEVADPEGRLLPGMTASLDFLVEGAESVLTVPNAALRFRPAGTAAASERAPATRPGEGRLYRVVGSGELEQIAVKTGISNGSATEVSGDGVSEGMQIVVGTVTEQSAAQGAQSPFTPQRPARRGGRM